MLRIHLEHALADFALSVDLQCRYATTALYGPSGAGKTTLLHMIAGLLRPDRGEISVGDDVLFSSERGIDQPPEVRGIGYVFQRDLLFPHLSVERNLRYGHDLLPSTARRFAIPQIVELLEIGSLLKRSPAHLSGGERQRVALGRALLSSPRLLLMDEPTNHLDIESREALVEALTAYSGAVILVSHDMHLLELVADRLWLVNNGRVTPYEEDLESYRKQLLSVDKSAKKIAIKAERPKAASREKILSLRSDVRKSEARLEKLNEMRDKLAIKLADSALYDDTRIGELATWNKKYAEVMEALERAEALWLAAQQKLESAENH